MASRTVADFQAETWSLYSVAVCFTAIRFAARVKAVGLRGLRPDDLLSMVAILPFTAVTVIAHRGGTLYYTPRDRPPPGVGGSGLPKPGEPGHSLWLTGQKLHFALWNAYGATLWLLKASLLVLYMRLTVGLAGTYRLRNFLGFGLVFASWVAFLLTVYLGCRPFNRYFQSYPMPPNHCQPAVSKRIVWVCYAGNVLTDLYLMTIPLPMLWSAKLPTWKKSGLLLLFSGGVIVIVFATIRCVLVTLNPMHGAALAGTWAVREAFVAIITANAPMAFTIIRAMFGPAFNSIRSSPEDTPATPLQTYGSSSKQSNRMKGPNRQTMTNLIFSESEERIVRGDDSPPLNAQRVSEDVEKGLTLVSSKPQG